MSQGWRVSDSQEAFRCIWSITSYDRDAPESLQSLLLDKLLTTTCNDCSTYVQECIVEMTILYKGVNCSEQVWTVLKTPVSCHRPDFSVWPYKAFCLLHCYLPTTYQSRVAFSERKTRLSSDAADKGNAAWLGTKTVILRRFLRQRALCPRGIESPLIEESK